MEAALSTSDRILQRLGRAASILSQRDRAAAERLRYFEECARLGLDPSHGIDDPFWFALEVISCPDH